MRRGISTSQHEVVGAIEQRLLMARDSARRLEAVRSSIAEAAAHDPDYAHELAWNGVRLATELRDAPALAELTRWQGRCALASGRHADGLRHLGEAREMFGELGNHAEEVATATMLGDAFAAAGDPQQALEWYRLAHAAAQQHGLAGHESAVLAALGAMRADIGDFPLALDLQLESLAIREGLGDLDGIGAALLAVGTLYRRVGNRDAAFDCLNRSIAAFRESGNRYQEVRALTALGDLYYAAGNLETAMEHALRSIAIYEALGDPENVARALMAIAGIQSELRHHDIALGFAVRAYALLDSGSDDALRARALLAIGGIRSRLGAHEEALFVFDQALRIAHELDQPHLQHELHHAIAGTYESLGDPTRALVHFKRYARLREEIAGQERQKALAEIQVRFDLEKAERERELYRVRTAQLEAEMRLKQNELTAMALNLVQKKELIDEMKAQVTGLLGGGQHERATINEMLSKIESAKHGDQDWKRFEEQLGTLHHDFVHTLAERYPSLTPTEIRVCSLVRIDLSTKDIANLLYTSIRTIHAHKYNIRKKLELDTGANLGTFLAGL
ncbi:MAG: tetratricopeptide repeat protein [Bacteroidetes bacterium]|nr:tetratricopeptide repeat protein [Bacteroidota bacterium]